MDLDFTKRKPIKCKYCSKTKGDHRANTFQCPEGKKDRTVGYTQYSSTTVFEPKSNKE
jgi:hypothetical protein